MTDEQEDILVKIVENHGECAGWATRSICSKCPLSKLVQKEDGEYLSCIEAIGAQELSSIEANDKYIKVALRLLADKLVNDLLVKKEDE
jgi:hypothetical protein